MHARRPGSEGFTLVEVLVALAIMAVMAALAWQGVAGMLRSRDAGQQAIERTSRLATIMVQWEQDLREIQETDVVPAIAYDGQTLRLTRTARGGVVLVAWSLHNGRWMRWTSPPTRQAPALLEAWLGSQQLLGNEPGQVQLLDGVTDWQVYFFRGGAWTNPQSSADLAAAPVPASAASGASPAAAATRSLAPEGVRLQVTLDGQQQITRDVALGTRQERS